MLTRGKRKITTIFSLPNTSPSKYQQYVMASHAKQHNIFLRCLAGAGQQIISTGRTQRQSIGYFTCATSNFLAVNTTMTARTLARKDCILSGNLLHKRSSNSKLQSR
jgi:hypothetical protein